MKHCETPEPCFPRFPSPSPLPSLREGRWGFGAVVPLIRFGVVHLHRTEELVSVKAAHDVDGFAQHGHAGVAAGGDHTAKHPPVVAGRIVHLDAAERVGAVEAAHDKQLACVEANISK